MQEITNSHQILHTFLQSHHNLLLIEKGALRCSTQGVRLQSFKHRGKGMVEACIVDIRSQELHPLRMRDVPNLDLQLISKDVAECQNINPIETFDGERKISVWL